MKNRETPIEQHLQTVKNEDEKKNDRFSSWKVGDTLIFKDDRSVTAKVTKITPEQIWIKSEHGTEKLDRDGFDIETWRKKA